MSRNLPPFGDVVVMPHQERPGEKAAENASHPARRSGASPAAFLKLQSLLNQPVVDLAEVSSVVDGEPVLLSWIHQLAQWPEGDIRHTTSDCIVQIGIEAMRTLTEAVLAQPFWENQSK